MKAIIAVTQQHIDEALPYANACALALAFQDACPDLDFVSVQRDCVIVKEGGQNVRIDLPGRAIAFVSASTPGAPASNYKLEPMEFEVEI